MTFPAATACVSFFEIREDRLGLGNLLSRFGFAHLAQAKTQAIENARHRTGSRHLLLRKYLGPECPDCGFRRQPRIGQRRPKGGSLLGLRFGYRAQGCSCLRGLGFPPLPPTEGRLRSQTGNARAALGHPDFNRLAAPPKPALCLAGIPCPVLLRHLRLKGSSLRAAHLRGSQAQIGNRLRIDLLSTSLGSPFA